METEVFIRVRGLMQNRGGLCRVFCLLSGTDVVISSCKPMLIRLHNLNANFQGETLWEISKIKPKPESEGLVLAMALFLLEGMRMRMSKSLQLQGN